jgi:GNAT superfamily N-acetyltransferase
MRVRQVVPADWQTWRTIRLAALRSDPDAFGSTLERELALSERDWKDRLAGESGPAVLGLVDHHPVGMGAGWIYEPGRLMVVAMWTMPVWRGRGVGRRVLDAVVGWADDRSLRVDLWVADHNPAARGLYERAGFAANGDARSLREGSALTMSRLVLER